MRLPAGRAIGLPKSTSLIWKPRYIRVIEAHGAGCSERAQTSKLATERERERENSRFVRTLGRKEMRDRINFPDVLRAKVLRSTVIENDVSDSGEAGLNLVLGRQ